MRHVLLVSLFSLGLTANSLAQAEQAMPRRPIPYEITQFDKYVGWYQSPQQPALIFWIKRNGNNFLSELPRQWPVYLFPESQTNFFATQVHEQFSFDVDSHGNVVGLMLHVNGKELSLKRIDDALGKKEFTSYDWRWRHPRFDPFYYLSDGVEKIYLY